MSNPDNEHTPINYLRHALLKGLPRNEKWNNWDIAIQKHLNKKTDLSPILPEFVYWLLTSQETGIKQYLQHDSDLLETLDYVSELYQRVLENKTVPLFVWTRFVWISATKSIRNIATKAIANGEKSETIWSVMAVSLAAESMVLVPSIGIFAETVAQAHWAAGITVLNDATYIVMAEKLLELLNNMYSYDD